MQGVNQRLINVFNLGLSRSPIDFGIAFMGGLRTAEKQNELFKAGVSKCDGYDKKSRHQFGEALDFIPYVGGQYLLPSVYHNKYYFIIFGVIYSASIELNIPVRFGANWDGDEIWIDDQDFDDYPHVELK